MNFSSKQIEKLLGVGNGAVRNARYRLRLKLGLEQDTDLQEFLSRV